ncbi:MAG TPA: NrdH-redoxin [Eubacteriaceae bacterium]|nr:NrdH-redoxin [Eubacteriaceae bacterium]
MDENPAYRDEFMKLGGRGVPSFLIGDEFIVGLDTDRIENAMKNEVVTCPNCETRLRVPSGKGKIKITCKNCGHQFEQNT